MAKLDQRLRSQQNQEKCMLEPAASQQYPDLDLVQQVLYEETAKEWWSAKIKESEVVLEREESNSDHENGVNFRFEVRLAVKPCRAEGQTIGTCCDEWLAQHNLPRIEDFLSRREGDEAILSVGFPKNWDQQVSRDNRQIRFDLKIGSDQARKYYQDLVKYYFEQIADEAPKSCSEETESEEPYEDAWTRNWSFKWLRERLPKMSDPPGFLVFHQPAPNALCPIPLTQKELEAAFFAEFPDADEATEVSLSLSSDLEQIFAVGMAVEPHGRGLCLRLDPKEYMARLQMVKYGDQWYEARELLSMFGHVSRQSQI